jgi:hypothetical protein
MVASAAVNSVMLETTADALGMSCRAEHELSAIGICAPRSIRASKSEPSAAPPASSAQRWRQSNGSPSPGPWPLIKPRPAQYHCRLCAAAQTPAVGHDRAAGAGREGHRRLRPRWRHLHKHAN